MCGDSGFDDNIDSILIPHPDRVARQQQTQFHEGAIYLPALNDIDILAEAYVPFDSSADAATAAALAEEKQTNSAYLALLIVGFIFAVLALMDFVAKGNSIPPTKAFNFSSSRLPGVYK